MKEYIIKVEDEITPEDIGYALTKYCKEHGLPDNFTIQEQKETP